MANYFANTSISVPLYTGLSVDVQLGGLSFSYAQGMFYDMSAAQTPMTPPPPFPTVPGGSAATPAGGTAG
jgi:hypothetical protein